MTEDWADVQAAVQTMKRAYFALLAERGDGRAGTKKLAKLEANFALAHSNRAEVLERHWIEADGWHETEDGPQHSLGPVLQRYYAELASESDKKVKR